METKTTEVKSVTITEDEFIHIFTDASADTANGMSDAAKEVGKKPDPMLDLVFMLHDASVCSRVCRKLFGDDEDNKEE